MRAPSVWPCVVVGAALLGGCTGGDESAPAEPTLRVVLGVGPACASQVTQIDFEIRSSGRAVVHQSRPVDKASELPISMAVASPRGEGPHVAQATFHLRSAPGQAQLSVLLPGDTAGHITLALPCVCLAAQCPDGANCREQPAGSGHTVCEAPALVDVTAPPDDGALDGGTSEFPSCGDGACKAPETCASCPQDCGACGPACGDGACEAGESCTSCAKDCGACKPACGNGQCDGGETCQSCTQDCGPCPPACGNGQCDSGETCQSCAQDCGVCVTDETCQALIVGGSLGAVAAAHELGSLGKDVCLVHEDDWLGGQATSQGTPFDDYPADGSMPRSLSYATLQDRVRQKYGHSNADGFNPGQCWVSGLCAEPKTVQAVVQEMLGELPSIRRRPSHRLKGLLLGGSQVQGATFRAPDGGELRVHAPITIDATELGDAWPLLCPDKSCYRTGAEAASFLGEPDAPPAADPDCVQPFTVPFAVEQHPGDPDTDQGFGVAPPPSCTPEVWGAFALAHDGNDFLGHFFTPRDDQRSFWSYRRIRSAANFGGDEVALINWGGEPAGVGNDYNAACAPGCNVIDQGAQADLIVQAARDRSLCFLWWMQNQVPRDDGGKGYRTLSLRGDVFDSPDGLARSPYFREARRLNARTVVSEVDLINDGGVQGSNNLESLMYRATTRYSDSVGVSQYSIDIHACAGAPKPQISVSPGHAQIPLGALVPAGYQGILAGAKNIGTTHLSNGVYRLHSAEWSVGQAAGAAAGVALDSGKLPHEVLDDTKLRRTVQLRLVSDRGAPIYTWKDFWDKRAPGGWAGVAAKDRAAQIAAQMVGVAGLYLGNPADGLVFTPSAPIQRGQAAVLITRLFSIAPATGCGSAVPQRFSDVGCEHPQWGYIEALAALKIVVGFGDGTYQPEATTLRGQFAAMMGRAAGGQPFFDQAAGWGPYEYAKYAQEQGWLASDVEAGEPLRENDDLQRRSVVLWMFNRYRQQLGL